MSEHARLSPSNKRWPYCPGSVREEANYPDIPGDAAIDGTGSHILLEYCLTNNNQASDYNKSIIGANHKDKPSGWMVDIERCNRVQICLDYITRRKGELQKLFPDCEVIVESESISNPGSFIKRDDWWGTCDVTIKTVLNDSVVFIEVVDYKDGRGYVSEKWDTQLIAYLFGKILEINDNDGSVPDIGMRMTIVQPKTGTPIRYMCSTNPDHGLNKESLLAKVVWLNKCIYATDDPDAPLISGEHCQWCSHNPKRSGTCTALLDESMGVIKTMTNDLTVLNDNDGLLEFIKKAVSDVKSLSPDQLTKIADVKAGFQAAFDKVFTEIQERIESGTPVPGYAMVPGNAKKVWNESDDIIEKKLKAKRFKKNQIYPSKLISPAAALKLPGLTKIQKEKLKKELISEVIGKNVLKKVAYDNRKIKDTDTMFNDVGETKETVSFF